MADTSSEGSRSSFASPTVRRPSQGLPNWALYGLAGIAGIGIFAVLTSQREAADDTYALGPQRDTIISSPPPLRVATATYSDSPALPAARPVSRTPPPVIRAAAVPNVVSTPRQRSDPPPSEQGTYFAEEIPAPNYGTQDFFPRTVPSPLPPTSDRTPMPALVMDRGILRTERSAGSSARLSGSTRSQYDAASGSESNEETNLRPQQPPRGPYILPVGTLLPAILQTPVDTSRGGPVKAIVSQNVRGEDGTLVLVPKGTMLLGEYPPGAEGAGKRVMIDWTRLVLPDGREVEMTFPSTDRNGAAGVKGKLHTNTLGRVAGAVLQTALNAASFGLLNRATSDTVVVGMPQTTVGGQNANDSRRRITIKAGTRIQVYASQPIDFIP